MAEFEKFERLYYKVLFGKIIEFGKTFAADEGGPGNTGGNNWLSLSLQLSGVQVSY